MMHSQPSTRERILREIKARGQATIAALSEALQVSAISVRHHLASLQAEGLVTSVEVRHGVGRPRFSYALTPAAAERFPAKYVRFSARLLDELKVTLPPEAIEAVFARIAQGIVDEYTTQLEGKTLDEKMELLVDILGAEGFMAQWNRQGETINLTEYSCPYSLVGQRHPEICAIDQIVISQLLEASVEKKTCVLDGAERCLYVITPGGSRAVSVDSITFPESTP